MEEDLKSVMNWAQPNKIELNKSKFRLIQHGTEMI